MAYVRTALLMAAMTALFMAVGWLLAGWSGAVVALITAAGMNVVTWWNSDKMVLRMHGARPVPPSDRAGLHAMTAELARGAGMPVPAIYLIDTPQPNAFARGRDPQNAAVAVTSEGVVAELGAGAMHVVGLEAQEGRVRKPSAAWWRATNWSDHNAAPRKRGSLLIWLDREMAWLAPPEGRPGRPAVFTDAAI